ILSRDQKRAALPDSSNSVRLWDLLRQQPLGGSIQLTDWPTCTAFGRNSNLVVVDVVVIGCKDGTLGVWTVKDSHRIATLMQPRDEVRAVEFSPDGDLLATA